MSTRTTPLDERYGRTRDRRRRGRLVVGGVVGAIVVAAVAWGVWTGVGGATDPLDVTTTGVDVQGDGTVEVQWLVSGRAGARLVCAIEGQDRQGVVVGLQEVVVPASGAVNRTGATVVRTVRRASNGLIDSCRDA